MANRIELKVNIEHPKANLERPIYLDGTNYKVDVRNFLTPKDCKLKKIAKDNQWRAGTAYDKKMQKVWEYMRDNTEYKTDMIDRTKSDHWTLPSIVLQRGYDDCDGLAVTMASLAMAAGIPYYRIKVALGKVSKDRYAPTGGHAWVLYLNEADEWEMWESTAKKQGRKGILDILGKSWYHSIYNTFNLKHSFKH